MLSSDLNKQAQSGPPGALTQLHSNWTTPGAPSAVLSTSNMLPIICDETGNNCKFDIPGLSTSSFVSITIVHNRIPGQEESLFIHFKSCCPGSLHESYLVSEV